MKGPNFKANAQGHWPLLHTKEYSETEGTKVKSKGTETMASMALV